MEVPPDATGTGWYVHSPVPGDLGPAVLAAHVVYGGLPGVFTRLGDLRPGAAVTVRRADGADVTFVVDRVERYPKTAFPSAAVYGDTPGPELRLITCGGPSTTPRGATRTTSSAMRAGCDGRLIR